MHQSGEGDWQHEDIDRQQVQGKQPDRLGQMVLVDVLHHTDLELSRQKQDRQHRQENQRRPGAIGAGRTAEGQQLVNIGQLRGPIEDIGETVVKNEGDKNPHGEESQQLDQGLEGNGSHHALVALRGIQMAGTEHNGEQCQQQCHIEGRILQRAHGLALVGHLDGGVLPEYQEAAGHRLELQGDVGNHPDHRDQGDEPTQQRTLAVARGDEIGN